MEPAMMTLDTTDFTALRHRMIEADLRGRGISDPRVLMAMAEVPREEFVLRISCMVTTA